MGEALLTWSPPQRFDEFEVLGPLGRGGMGRVFLARDAHLDRKVALKFIAADRPDEASRSRFSAEARAIARLSHPNVVSVYRIGEVEGRPFISYELVLGQTLDEMAVPVHWSTLLPIAVGIVSGLAAAHREGLVHGDVKPSNIVLSLDGVPKLIDFGLARMHEPEKEAVGPVARRVAGGTPAYMAPELLEGQRPGPRADLFALGLLVRDLLTGDTSRSALPPHKLAQLLRRGLPPTAAACPEVPAALGRLIDRCLRPRPEERYEDAAGLFAELAPLRDVLVSASVASPVVPPDAVVLSECLGRIWERIDAFTEDLYARLFGTYPELRSLFPDSMREQRAKLAHALKLVVEGLRTPERLRSSLIELGRRHASYGIAESELTRLGPVLLAALRDADQADWNDELEAAWLRGWHLVLESMRLGYSHSEETQWSASRSVAAVTETALEPVSFQLPRTLYASSGDAQLAWHEFGQGAIDILMLPPWLSHLEMPWRQPEYAAFLRGMGRLGRSLRYDRRGTGLSDREATSHQGDDVADALAVMDAASAKSVLVFAPYDAARIALELAAAHPARVRGLVLYGTTLKAIRDAECTFGRPRELLEARVADLAEHWGERALLDVVAPSRQKDAGFRHFWGQYMRMALTPRKAVRELERAHVLDLRTLARRCSTPTLVLHRAGDRNVPVAGARALAEQLSKSTFVELTGEDHLPFLGDASALLRELERFASAL